MEVRGRGRLYTYRGGKGVWRWGEEGVYTYRGGKGCGGGGKREIVYLSRREWGVEVGGRGSVYLSRREGVWRWGEEGDCIPIAEGSGCGGGGKREIVYLSWREWGVEVGGRGRLYTYRGGNGVWRWGEEGDCNSITMLSPPE